MERTEESLSTRDLATPAARDDEPEPVAPRPAAVGDDEAVAADPAREPEPAHAHAPDGDGTHADEAPGRLFPEDEQEGFQHRWESIQAGFVDDPRHAVEEADALVASVMTRLAEGFAQEREGLEGQWDRGEDVSTEDLRVALQRYRSFFRRLLSA